MSFKLPQIYSMVFDYFLLTKNQRQVFNFPTRIKAFGWQRCWWQFVDVCSWYSILVTMLPKNLLNFGDPSPTSNNCRQHILSPTSFLGVDKVLKVFLEFRPRSYHSFIFISVPGTNDQRASNGRLQNFDDGSTTNEPTIYNLLKR